MTRRQVAKSLLVFVLPVAVAALLVTQGWAQPRRDRSGLREPVYRVAAAPKDRPAAVREHPLIPAIRMAKDGIKYIRTNVKDYTCTLVKRERVNGKLLDREYIYMKVRTEQTDANGNVTTPFAVYLNFIAPDTIKGREVLWIKGENNNRLVAHEGGRVMGLITANLDPNCGLAMRNCRYPITEIGIENLLVKLVEQAEKDAKYGECDVQYFNNAKINGRVCTCIQVTHPVPRKNFQFHIARIFIDKELNLPVRFASWGWPKKKGGKPVLFEEYTYVNLKTNQNLQKIDFDRKNPKYNF